MLEGDIHAAVDLGSNSFHLIVARVEHGQMRVIDRLKDMVRLGGGLDAEGRLDRDVREHALASLARFGERLHDIPDARIRAAGTQTLRRLRHPESFLVVAETALGCPIDIISGREEARLVYLGVSQDVPAAAGKRLVIDIGGGSTELALGTGLEPELTESLDYGCVSISRDHFPDGSIDTARWKAGKREILAEMQGLATSFRRAGWQQAIGASGTMRAVAAMLAAHDPSTAGTITTAGVEELAREICRQGHRDTLAFEGLSRRRAPVIAGGVLILDAVMSALGIERLTVSDYALREGLLQDLLGRLEHRDPRANPSAAMAERYQCDREQAARVADWARSGFEQVASNWHLSEEHGDLLAWTCLVHEIGLAIAHDGQADHGAYILEHADMPGFGRVEQRFLAALARLQRRKPSNTALDALPARLRDPARRAATLLRLAVTMNRARADSQVGRFGLEARQERLILSLPDGWLEAHPLNAHDLAAEQRCLRRLDIELELVSFDTPAS